MKLMNRCIRSLIILIASLCVSFELSGQTSVTPSDGAVILSNGWFTCNTGIDPIAIYDSGGKNGSYKNNEKCIFTFTPSDTGKKVRIRLSNIDIFNNPSSIPFGNNDVIKIYSGKEEKSENLIYTIISQRSADLMSTSPDGAMTIVFVSKNGRVGSGFEGVVTEEVPADMKIGSVSLYRDNRKERNIAYASQKCIPMLGMNIEAHNTLNAKKLTKIVFSCDAGTALVEKATLFASSDNTFTQSKKLGELIFENSRGLKTLELDDAFDLSQGENHIWLAFDVDRMSVNGQKLSASVSKLVFESDEKDVSGITTPIDIKIDNRWISTEGVNNIYVFSPWRFVATAGSYYSTMATTEDHVVTFYPGDNDKVVQLDFSMFSIYWDKNNYSPNPKFIILSGSDPNGTDVLFQLNGENNRKIPQRIKSKSPDGAITVVWNHKGSRADRGWEAEVSQYKSEPMKFVSASVEQPDTGNIPVFNAPQNITMATLRIVTSGDRKNLELKSFKVRLKGASSIARLYLYSNIDTGIATDISKAIATVDEDAVGELTVVNIPRGIALNEGNNDFRISFDVKKSPKDKAIDISVLSLNIDEDEILLTENNDPEGEFQLVNSVNMPTGGESKIVNVGEETVVFYDNGGAGDKSSEQKTAGVITFRPSSPGKVIKAIVKSFDVGVNETLEMYYGGSSEGAVVVADRKTMKVGDEYVSSSEGGEITFRYMNRNKYTKAGWEIHIEEYVPQPIEIVSVGVEDISSGKTLKGAKSLMLKLSVKVTGDKGLQTISSLSFDTKGSFGNIAKAVVYDTDKSELINRDVVFGMNDHISEDVFLVNGEKTYTSSGTYYMFLEYVIGDQSKENSLVYAKAKDINISGYASKMNFSDDVSATVTVSKGFNGSYVIGTSSEADYKTIDEAIKAMEIGVDGKVDFAIEDGIYEENILFNHIKGTSETNTVTFRSLSSSPSSVCIFHNKYKAPGYSENKSFEERGVITLDSVQYFTLKGITVKTQDTNYPMVIKMRSSCSNITFDNVTVEAPQNTTYTDGYLIRTYVGMGKTDNMPSRNISLRDCKLIGGRMGVSFGSTWVSKGAEKGFEIINSTFEKQGAKAIYISGVDNLLIKGNNIISGAGLSSSSTDVMDITAGEDVAIDGNYIYLSSEGTKDNNVFYIRDIKATENKPFVIANNQVIVEAKDKSRANVFSFNARGEGIHNIQILYNTIQTKGMDSGCAILNYQTLRSRFVGGIVANNIFQSYNGTVHKFGSNIEGLEFSGNVSFTSGDNYSLKKGTKTTFEEWKASPWVRSAVNKEVQFKTQKILFPISDEGLNIVTEPFGIQYDIVGNSREGNNTVGAYVYSDVIPEIRLHDGYPNISSVTNNSISLNIKFDNSGSYRLIVRKKNEQAPQFADFNDTEYSFDVKKDMESQAKIDGLSRATQYTVYILGYNIIGESSKAIYKIDVETETDPTLPASFENIYTDENGNVISGTFKFSNISVVETQGNAYSSDSRKMAEISTDVDASVTFTNRETPQVLKGFFYNAKGNSVIKLTLTDGNGENKEVKFPLDDTHGEWSYFNLKDKGYIKNITLNTGGKLLLDDFNGSPLPFVFSLEDKEANHGDRISWTVEKELKNGVAPYSYKWTKIGQDETPLSGNEINITAERLMQYSVEGIDAWGQKHTETAWIRVVSPIQIATFEDYKISDENAYYIGDISKIEDVNTGINTQWYSGSFRFGATAHMSTWWSGYALSNENSREFNGLQDQFRVSAASGLDGSKGFLVAYPMWDNVNKIEVTSSSQGDIVKGVFVCNTSYVVNSIVKGDRFSSVFGDGDYFKVIFKGTNADGETKTVEYYLADFRNQDNKEHYYIDSWQWVDLTSLGKVKYISLDFESNKRNQYGITVPAYICLDNLGDKYHVEEIRTHKLILGNNHIKLKEFTSFNEADAKITYEIQEYPDPDIAKVSISQDGVMSIDVLKDFQQDADVILKISQKGKTVYQRHPISLVRGTNIGNDLKGRNEVEIYPVPADNTINISCGGKMGYTVDIFSIDGVLVRKSVGLTACNSIDVSDLHNGNYFIKINIDGKILVKKIIIRH